MSEQRQLEIMNLMARFAIKDPPAGTTGLFIENITGLADAIDEFLIRNTRCPNQLKKFVDYMNEYKDQRFMQGVRNFMKYDFLLKANKNTEMGEPYNIWDSRSIQDTFYDETK